MPLTGLESYMARLIPTEYVFDSSQSAECRHRIESIVYLNEPYDLTLLCTPLFE